MPDVLPVAITAAAGDAAVAEAKEVSTAVEETDAEANTTVLVLTVTGITSVLPVDPVRADMV